MLFYQRDNPAMLFDGYDLRSSPTGPRNAYDILQTMNLLGAAYRQYQASDNQRRSMEKPKWRSIYSIKFLTELEIRNWKALFNSVEEVDDVESWSLTSLYPKEKFIFSFHPELVQSCIFLGMSWY